MALEIVPVSPEADPPGLRYAFNIAMGVRRGDEALQKEINAILAHRKEEIEKILKEYGVPMLPIQQFQREKDED